MIPQSSCPAGEQLKTHGNQKMAGGQYREAVGYYTKAIEMDGQAAIYYANRAAAHTHLKDYGQRPFKDPWSGGGGWVPPHLTPTHWDMGGGQVEWEAPGREYS